MIFAQQRELNDNVCDFTLPPRNMHLFIQSLGCIHFILDFHVPSDWFFFQVESVDVTLWWHLQSGIDCSSGTLLQSSLAGLSHWIPKSGLRAWILGVPLCAYVTFPEEWGLHFDWVWKGKFSVRNYCAEVEVMHWGEVYPNSGCMSATTEIE